VWRTGCAGDNLEHLGRVIINRLQQERALAIFLVSASTLLSTVLTKVSALGRAAAYTCKSRFSLKHGA
jgi:hypothetical protein